MSVFSFTKFASEYLSISFYRVFLLCLISLRVFFRLLLVDAKQTYVVGLFRYHVRILCTCKFYFRSVLSHSPSAEYLDFLSVICTWSHQRVASVCCSYYIININIIIIIVNGLKFKCKTFVQNLRTDQLDAAIGRRMLSSDDRIENRILFGSSKCKHKAISMWMWINQSRLTRVIDHWNKYNRFNLYSKLVDVILARPVRSGIYI